MFYLETNSTDPYYNLAFEEFVLKNCVKGDYCILWQNDNTIVVGQNQNPYEEICEKYVKEQGIKVVRRATGGGAVYHDLGNINFSFITDVGDSENLTMELFSTPVVDALCSLGIDAEVSGRNDIIASGCKVSGTAQRIAGRRILFHGTLLFDSDLERVSHALNPDPLKFQSKAVKSVKSRVGNIKTMLADDRKMEIEEFWQYLKRFITGGDTEEINLSPEDIEAVRKLRNEKYATWEWNYGRIPHYNVKRKARFDGGIIEALIDVDKGYISNIHFFGDFLSMSDVDHVEDKLKGCRFCEEDVSGVLEQIDTKKYLGAITLDNLIELLFTE